MRKKLPAAPDQASAFVLADLSAPDGSYPPERVHTDYEARLAEAGIVFNDDGFCEQGFLLRRLTARALILETAWHQTIRALSEPYLDTKGRGAIVRAASRLQEDLDKTYALILRVRKAQGENLEPFLSAADQAIADDPRPEVTLQGQHPPDYSPACAGGSAGRGDLRARAQPVGDIDSTLARKRKRNQALRHNSL